MIKYSLLCLLSFFLFIGAAISAPLTAVQSDDEDEEEDEKLAKEPKRVKTVCYDELGCFSTEKPWGDFGLIPTLPQPPEEIQTRFLLFTRKGGRFWQQIVAGDDETLRSSYFDPSKPVKFVIHGFNAAVEVWVKDIAAEFLKIEDANIFAVDWEKGAKVMYRQAFANARLVAAQMVQLLKYLKVKPEDVHILGHSLGAHMGGYVGTALQGLGRITGMDPAGLFFEKMDDTLVRLDPTDAQFVDVIHTDGKNIVNQIKFEGGFGLWKPSGHVDVYVNGGKKQPGCGEVGPIEAIIDEGFANGTYHVFACNHVRSYEVLTTTILSTCPYRSYSCPSWEEFKTGRCLHCPEGDDKTCNGVGQKATKPRDGSVENMMWMATGAKPPFCHYHYHVQLTIANTKNKDQKGKFWFNLIGNKGRSGFVAVNGSDEDDDRFVIKPGSVIDFLVTSPVDLGKDITAVEVKWRHDSSWYDIIQWQFGTPTIYPQKVTTFSGEYQTSSSFCWFKVDPLQTLQSQTFSTQC